MRLTSSSRGAVDGAVRVDTRVVVIELKAGRSDGHNDHYLASLERALARWPLAVCAPYRDRSAKRRRLPAVLHEVGLMWRALHPPRGQSQLVLVQNPWVVEKSVLALSALGPRRDAKAVFVLRRTGRDLHAQSHPAAALASRIAERMVTFALRRRWLYPVSDSRLVLDYWRQRAGLDLGSTVALPPVAGLKLGDAPGDAKRQERAGGPVVAMIGAFRTERGARHYDTVIECALELIDDVTVHVQLGGHEQDGSLAIAESIRGRWGGDDRVHLHQGHLLADEYGRLLTDADLIVLPYDADSYSTGTSGVLYEAVTVGATVLTAPLAWALDQYSENPRVRFIDRWDRESLGRELPRAVQASVASRGAPVASPDETFRETWDQALRAALGSPNQSALTTER